MSNGFEVSRVEASIGVNLSELEAGYARADQRTERFATETAATLTKAEHSISRFATAGAAGMQRHAAASQAASTSVKQDLTSVGAAAQRAASMQTSAAAQGSAAIRTQATAHAQAASQMSVAAAKSATSLEAATSAMVGLHGRAATAAKAHAAVEAEAAAKVAAVTKASASVATAAASKQAAAAGTTAAATRASANQQIASLSGVRSHVGGVARSMAGGLGFAGAFGLAGAVGGVLKLSTTFDQTMSGVRAATRSTDAEFEKLRQTAIDLGGDTAFSATEVGAAMVELGKSGFNAQQNVAAIPGVLDAAAASGEGLAETTAIVANTLAQFDLAAGQSVRVADVLAQGANLTQGSIGSMGEALKYAGTGANEMGLSLEKTTGLIAMMVKAGIDGSQAGTSVRMGLQQIALGANAAAADFKKLDTINPTLTRIWKGAQPVPEKLRLMSTEFKKMDGTSRAAAAGIIFGTQASTGMLVALKNGPAAWDAWTKKMLTAKGSAREFGETLRDNLAGDVEQLQGALESAAIKTGDLFRDDFRDRVARFKVYIDSDDFAADAAAVMGAVVNIGDAIADTTVFLYQHRDAILIAATAYGALRLAAAGAAAAQAGAMALSMRGAGGKLAAAGVAGAASSAGTMAAAGGAAVQAAPKLARFAIMAGSAARALTVIGAATIGAQVLYSLATSGDEAGESAAVAAARIADLKQEIIDIPVEKVTTVVVKTNRVDGKPGAGGQGAPKVPVLAPRIDIANGGVLAAAAREDEKAADRVTAAIKRQRDARSEMMNLQSSAAGTQQRYEREVQQLMDAGLSRIQAEGHPSIEGLRKRWESTTKAAADAKKEFGGTVQPLRDLRANAANASSALEAAYRKMAGMGNKKMTGGMAEQLVKDMEDGARVAVFGTTNVNNALKKMGYVNVNGKWYRSLAEGVAASNAIAGSGKDTINAALAQAGKVGASGNWLSSFRSQLAQAIAAGNQGVAVRFYATGLRDIKTSSYGTHAPVVGPKGHSADDAGPSAAGWGAGGGRSNTYRGPDQRSTIYRMPPSPIVGARNTATLRQAAKQATIDDDAVLSFGQARSRYNATITAIAKVKRGGVSKKEKETLADLQEKLKERAEDLVAKQSAKFAAAADRSELTAQAADLGVTVSKKSKLSNAAIQKSVAAEDRRQENAVASIEKAMSRTDSARQLNRAEASSRPGDYAGQIAAAEGAIGDERKRQQLIEAQLSQGKLSASRQEQLRAALDQSKIAVLGLSSEITQLAAQQREEMLDAPRKAMRLTDAKQNYAIAYADSTEDKTDDVTTRRDALNDEVRRRDQILSIINRGDLNEEEAAAKWDEMTASQQRSASLLSEIKNIEQQAAQDSQALLQAMLEQAQSAAAIATTNMQISENALRALGSSGDIGVSGYSNALSAAYGQSPVNINFSSVVPYTGQQAALVADMVGVGAQYNGLAAKSYAPVLQIGA